MTYFKVIQGSQVVDAGFVFLKWNETRHKMNISDENEAQFVQSYNQELVYRDDWLKPFPEKCAAKFEKAQVVIIDQNEFEEIRALLDGDEIIPVLSDAPEEVVIEPAKPAEETPLSISDMRRIILEQQEQINQLSERLDAIRK